MLLKQGVWYNPHRYIRKIMPDIDDAYKNITSQEVVITSCGDGKHSVDSLHYVQPSMAIDIRFPREKEDHVSAAIKGILTAWAEEFGIRYDFVKEETHYHIEAEI